MRRENSCLFGCVPSGRIKDIAKNLANNQLTYAYAASAAEQLFAMVASGHTMARDIALTNDAAGRDAANNTGMTALVNDVTEAEDTFVAAATGGR